MKQAVPIMILMFVYILLGFNTFAQTENNCLTDCTIEPSLVIVNTFKSELTKTCPENYFRPNGFQEHNVSFQLQNSEEYSNCGRNGFRIGLGAGIIPGLALAYEYAQNDEVIFVAIFGTALLGGATGYLIGSIVDEIRNGQSTRPPKYSRYRQSACSKKWWRN